jgi:hypothetical protein
VTATVSLISIHLDIYIYILRVLSHSDVPVVEVSPSSVTRYLNSLDPPDLLLTNIHIRKVLYSNHSYCLSQMTHNGKVAKKMYQYMNYTDNEGFREPWDLWIAKHVRNVINEKISAITQAIHKSIVRGKKTRITCSF